MTRRSTGRMSAKGITIVKRPAVPLKIWLDRRGRKSLASCRRVILVLGLGLGPHVLRAETAAVAAATALGLVRRT